MILDNMLSLGFIIAKSPLKVTKESLPLDFGRRPILFFVVIPPITIVCEPLPLALLLRSFPVRHRTVRATV